MAPTAIIGDTRSTRHQGDTTMSETSNAAPTNWQREVQVPSPQRPTLGSGHRALGRALIVLLAGCVGVSALKVMLDLYGLILFNRWEADPSTIRIADGDYFDTMHLVLIGLWGLAVLATGVCTMTWLYQAYGSREADPDALTRKRWWTIGGWLIPFISLVRPFQLLRDLYGATTDPNPEMRPDRRRTLEYPRRLRWWWATFVLGNMLANVAARPVADDAGLGHLKTAVSLDMISQAILIAAAVLFIGVLSSITSNLRRRAMV